MLDRMLHLPARPKVRITSGTAAREGTTARFQGRPEPPVIVAVIQGPVAAEMALEALTEAGIPALLRRNPVGTVYGMSLGTWGETPVLVPSALRDQAHDILAGMGLVDDA